jgi:hypothetical protein
LPATYIAKTIKIILHIGCKVQTKKKRKQKHNMFTFGTWVELQSTSSPQAKEYGIQPLCSSKTSTWTSILF